MKKEVSDRIINAIEKGTGNGCDHWYEMVEEPLFKCFCCNCVYYAIRITDEIIRIFSRIPMWSGVRFAYLFGFVLTIPFIIPIILYTIYKEINDVFGRISIRNNPRYKKFKKQYEEEKNNNKSINDKEYSNKILSFANKSNFFTSKNEVFIRNYFILNFPNDEWTFGGRLKYKNEFISRDLYSKKMKICFEYDGIWHFKNIKNQLEKKKKKDILLEKWCIENNWRLIRISETWFIEHNKPINDIVEIIYKSKEPIIKIGKEYEM